MDKWQEVLLSLYDLSSTKILARLIDIIVLLTKCNNVALLRVESNGSSFEAYTNVNNSVRKVKCNKGDFPSLSHITSNNRTPLTFSNETDRLGLEQWQYIFPYRPYTVILIPIEASSAFTPAAVISYEVRTDLIASSAKIITVQQNIRILLTYAMTVARTEEDVNLIKVHNTVLAKAEQAITCIGEVDNCAKCVAWQTKSIVPCKAVVVFRIDLETQNLNLGYPSKLAQKSCPQKYNHLASEIDFVNSSLSISPVVWVARNKKTIRVNNMKNLESMCGKNYPDSIHSVGGCVVKNVMAFMIKDMSQQCTLVVELSESKDPAGFSDLDEYKLNLYCQLMAGIVSSVTFLEYYRRAIRRQEISSDLLRNVYTIRKDQMQIFSLQHILTAKSMKFSFCVKKLSENQTDSLIFAIFTKLNLPNRWKFTTQSLVRFILSVQQGYRDLPYHNWFHACSVTHFLFLMIQNLKLIERQFLRDIDVFSLIVAALTHDIDHRGTNSIFQLCTESDLYHMYKMEDSLMERHHFMYALGIMRRYDCNILENLDDEELREFVSLLSHNILATDLSMHIKTRGELFALLDNYSINNVDQRKALMSCLMTMCDLSDSTKYWNDNLPTVVIYEYEYIGIRCIFQEFFSQGDLERSYSWIPLQMMDRRIAYIPQIELIFLNNIVRPVFVAVAKCIPESKECVACIDYCKELWLISTRIFDQNVDKDDPLEILDLPGMQEEKLRNISNPTLLRMILKKRHDSDNIYDDVLSKCLLSMKDLRMNKLKKNSRGRKSIFEDTFKRGLSIQEESIVIKRQTFENEYMNSRARLYREHRAEEGEEYGPNIAD